MKKIFLFFLSVFLTNFLFGQHIPDVLLSSSIFIEHSKGTGSGFLLQNSSNTYLVTAKHNLYELNTNRLLVDEIRITSYFEDPTNSDKNVIIINLKIAESLKYILSTAKDDIALIKIAETEIKNDKILVKYFQNFVQKNVSAWINPIPIEVLLNYEDTHIGDEIYLFGYPTSIGLKNSPQYDFSKPLLRCGIIAGKYDKNKTIILDCPSYPGNSGGPVISKISDGIKIQYNLIGLIIQFIPYEEQWLNIKSGLVRTDRYNSGYSIAISINTIKKLINENK